jgi:hypothetical protein
MAEFTLRIRKNHDTASPFPVSSPRPFDYGARFGLPKNSRASD